MFAVGGLLAVACVPHAPPPAATPRRQLLSWVFSVIVCLYRQFALCLLTWSLLLG
jgi:hypothetical protein